MNQFLPESSKPLVAKRFINSHKLKGKYCHEKTILIKQNDCLAMVWTLLYVDKILLISSVFLRTTNLAYFLRQNSIFTQGQGQVAGQDSFSRTQEAGSNGRRSRGICHFAWGGKISRSHDWEAGRCLGIEHPHTCLSQHQGQSRLSTGQ